ncbi:MAG: hypothetical protein E6Q24_12565 [Chitinophagaceae bacterium]|nr:MAG: hypothetical protein E6Q24_12565 [Chitinophagaceae bacterium]
MSGLSERQQNICIYGGIFGVMLAATCLIQHIRFSTSHWIAFVLMGVYVYSLLVFVLLSLQKEISPLLMITSSALGNDRTCLYNSIRGLLFPGPDTIVSLLHSDHHRHLHGAVTHPAERKSTAEKTGRTGMEG